jgi:hypothetical protein
MQPAHQVPPAQSSTAKEEMPSDPAALLELAAKKNGLRNVQSSPWHLKASYQVLDEKGVAKDAGTLEEFWVSVRKSWIRYSSANFNQTLITNEQGVYRQGDAGTPKGPASLVRSRLFEGVSVPQDLSKVKLNLDDRNLGSITLKCITTERADAVAVAPMSVQCLSHDLPVLRVAVGSGGYLQTVYNEVALFEGVFIANSIDLKNGSRTILHVHIETLESYLPKDDLFVAPTDAVFTPPRVAEPGAVIVGNIVRKVAPSYPALAKQQGIQGVVILHAIITPEGKIANLEPIIGPPALIPPSLDAVKRWEYRPYLLDGVPVEVETEINVIFSLGG